ncbi:hypothetical protein [Methanosphaerula palustris]|uniref:DUF2178 domain-containing protein n=1 Tax=Methanosphaerula palustris (strain ATCC BAA-1556 / DSM 19958 / E1-9c) TaxID=521011 RepID=B8GJ55_METPE|nr:hypothetical protein [Methanosphaerula palustris]ACL15628.1 conserved hypothetical protein [Methanosphaerula palustris E1-9c]
MKQRNLNRLVVGVLMIISGIAALVLNTGETAVGTTLFFAGCAFLAVGIVRHRQYGDDLESDERSRKTGAYGLSYAWLTGLFFMFALFWLDYLNLLRLGTQGALALSIVVLALSGRLYQVYLFWRGDVE